MGEEEGEEEEEEVWKKCHVFCLISFEGSLTRPVNSHHKEKLFLWLNTLILTAINLQKQAPQGIALYLKRIYIARPRAVHLLFLPLGLCKHHQLSGKASEHGKNTLNFNRIKWRIRQQLIVEWSLKCDLPRSALTKSPSDPIVRMCLQSTVSPSQHSSVQVLQQLFLSFHLCGEPGAFQCIYV